MTDVEQLRAFADLAEIAVSALRPVTLPGGTQYRLTQRQWDNFRAKIVESADGCWVWTGSANGTGYGGFSIFNIKRYRTYSHRIMYMLLVGDIPDGLHTDHLCRNRACCNPAHLEPVTCAENVRRSPIHPAAVNAQKTECIRGHPLSGDNLLVLARGARICRACSRIRDAKRSGNQVDADGYVVGGKSHRNSAWGDRTTCINGHPLVESNIYVKPNGRRTCRTCKAEYQVKWLAAKRAANDSGSGQRS